MWISVLQKGGTNVHFLTFDVQEYRFAEAKKLVQKTQDDNTFLRQYYEIPYV